MTGKALFNDSPDRNPIESEEPPPSNSSVFSKRKVFADKNQVNKFNTMMHQTNEFKEPQ
jgi:hypothetical protein